MSVRSLRSERSQQVLIWDANFSGIIALTIVMVLYAVLRDLRMLWQTGESGIQPQPKKGAAVYLQRSGGTNERSRTATEWG